jgi:hypothetical protein
MYQKTRISLSIRYIHPAGEQEPLRKPLSIADLRAIAWQNNLWKPLQPFLKEIKTVFMIPSGLLHQISFAALPADQSKFLCQQYNLKCFEQCPLFN